jgi:hypothetical protein
MLLPFEIQELKKLKEFMRLRAFRSEAGNYGEIGFRILLWDYEKEHRGGLIFDSDLKKLFGVDAFLAIEILKQKGWMKDDSRRCRVTDLGAIAGNVLQETNMLSKLGKYYLYLVLVWISLIVSFLISLGLWHV